MINMPTASGLKPGTLHNQVVRHMALRILSGGVENADMLLSTEAQWADHLDVSRTVLREAVKVLSAKRLVEVRPKRGISIRPRRDWDLLDSDVLAWLWESRADEKMLISLCEVRMIVEPAAAELSASRATKKEISELGARYRRLEASVGNAAEFLAADSDFHAQLLVCCHNELLQRIGERIVLLLISSNMAVIDRLAGSTRASLPFHLEVVEAIRSRNGDLARHAMQRLVKSAEKSVYSVFHHAARTAESSGIAKNRKKGLPAR